MQRHLDMQNHDCAGDGSGHATRRDIMSNEIYNVFFNYIYTFYVFSTSEIFIHTNQKKNNLHFTMSEKETSSYNQLTLYNDKDFAANREFVRIIFTDPFFDANHLSLPIDWNK